MMKLLLIILISFLFTKSFSVNSQALETMDVMIDGIRYIGEVKNGKRHGKGKQIEPNGATYEGEWKNDPLSHYKRFAGLKIIFFLRCLFFDFFQKFSQRLRLDQMNNF